MVKFEDFMILCFKYREQCKTLFSQGLKKKRTGKETQWLVFLFKDEASSRISWSQTSDGSGFYSLPSVVKKKIIKKCFYYLIHLEHSFKKMSSLCHYSPEKESLEK